MPELPEVETVRRGLEPVMTGEKIISAQQNRPDLRFPFPERFVERITGSTVLSLTRRAKYILANLSSGESMILHLGMSGAFRIEDDGSLDTPNSGTVAMAQFHYPRSEIKLHDHFRLTMGNGISVTYNDPRRFGFALLCQTDQLSAHPYLEHLGIEPMGNELSGRFLNKALRHKKSPLKAALLDQRIICGLGNIYVCEALFRSGLSPRRLAHTITRERGVSARADLLAQEIRATLGEALAAGGSTLRDFSHADGGLGYFQHAFKVYGREDEPCITKGCPGTIERITQSGRSSFFCSQCQR